MTVTFGVGSPLNQNVFQNLRIASQVTGNSCEDDVASDVHHVNFSGSLAFPLNYYDVNNLSVSIVL
jgi:hypothetical protein